MGIAIDIGKLFLFSSKLISLKVCCWRQKTRNLYNQIEAGGIVWLKTRNIQTLLYPLVKLTQTQGPQDCQGKLTL